MIDAKVDPLTNEKVTWDHEGPVVKIADDVDHPVHYGGGDNQHEHVKCAEAVGLTAHSHLYNATKYIWRAGKKGNRLQDLQKALWYLTREVANELASPEVKHPPYSVAENDWRGLYERQRGENIQLRAGLRKKTHGARPRRRVSDVKKKVTRKR